MIKSKMKRSIGCEPTYEELKQQNSLALVIFQEVASLPMRNWNSEELGKKLLKEFGCEPTYEELKQYK